MMSRTSAWILLLAVLAAAFGGWLQHRARLAHGERTAPGDMAPALALPDLDGRTHRLADFAGRRVLINLWASWCAPCLEEMPALNRAWLRHRAHAQVLGIAMDEPSRVRSLLAAHPVDYPILIGRLESPDTASLLGDSDGVLPYSVLLDEHGRVLARRRGRLDEATLERWLTPATPPTAP